MSRSTRSPLSRVLSAGVAAAGAAALLTGCIVVSPVISETPKPTSTGFGSIADDPQPIETGNPVEPTTDPSAGYTTLFDDLKVLTIKAPNSWSDVDGSPFTDNGGQQWASIVASTDIETYFQSYKTSGLEFAGIPLPEGVTDADIRAFLDSVTNYFLTDCDVIQQGQSYSDGFYTGYQSGFENCGGVETEGFGIVAIDKNNTHVVYVRAQIADEQAAEVYDAIVRSFQASITRAGGGK